MSLKVFLSYSRRDVTVARLIRDAMKSIGASCFLDESSINAGDPFPEAIGDAIRSSALVVVILSDNVTASSWVETEIREARVANKWIVPYRINPSVGRPEILPSHIQEVYDIGDLLRAVAPKISITDISAPDSKQLEVPGLNDVYSSFHPIDAANGSLLRLRMPTTSGWVPDIVRKGEVRKSGDQAIYLIRDPVRPFEIQIGETRSARPGGTPSAIELDPSVYNRAYLLGTWNQLIRHPDTTKWERAVLAEVAPDPELLREMYRAEKDAWIKELIGKNPSAPDDIRQAECRFCDQTFIDLRKIYPNKVLSERPPAVIINNDYPFGPHFHYIAFPTAPVHSWDMAKADHLLAMNVALAEFLGDQNNVRNAVGLRLGFNSSVRHVVAGAKTKASAGASISHIHKQAWGMADGCFNLGDHLTRICEVYDQRLGIDYLDCYLSTLRQARMLIGEDDYVAIYVPLGQIAVHELQIMIKRQTRTFLDLDYAELRSLSFAELGVAKLYAALGINSYNEIVISQRFDARAKTTFRVIVSFVTREIDLAVSELNLLYVTDKHPYDSVLEVNAHWDQVVKDNGLWFTR